MIVPVTIPESVSLIVTIKNGETRPDFRFVGTKGWTPEHPLVRDFFFSFCFLSLKNQVDLTLVFAKLVKRRTSWYQGTERDSVKNGLGKLESYFIDGGYWAI